MKREIYRLKWDRNSGFWRLYGPGKEEIRCHRYKEFLEVWSRRYCRELWGLGSTPCQLLIYTKAGKIGKGGRYEASYGCDSKRRKG